LDVLEQFGVVETRSSDDSDFGLHESYTRESELIKIARKSLV
jgi:hypothetical protein